MLDGVTNTTTTPNRPWYRKRRAWGILLGSTALVIATIPVAPLFAVAGLVTITTQTVATGLGLIASGVFGYGQGAKVEREKTNGK